MNDTSKKVCNGCPDRYEGCRASVTKQPTSEELLLSDVNGKDIPQITHDLEEAHLSSLFSYRQAYCVGAKAELSHFKPIVEARVRREIGEWLEKFVYINDYGDAALTTNFNFEYIDTLKSGKSIESEEKK